MNLKVILQEIGELTECGLPRYFLGTVNGAGDQIPNAKQLEDAVFECVADHIVGIIDKSVGNLVSFCIPDRLI